MAVWPSASHQPSPLYDGDWETQVPGENPTPCGVSRVIYSHGLGVLSISKWELWKGKDWVYLFHHYLPTTSTYSETSVLPGSLLRFFEE